MATTSRRGAKRSYAAATGNGAATTNDMASALGLHDDDNVAIPDMSVIDVTAETQRQRRRRADDEASIASALHNSRQRQGIESMFGAASRRASGRHNAQFLFAAGMAQPPSSSDMAHSLATRLAVGGVVEIPFDAHFNERAHHVEGGLIPFRPPDSANSDDDDVDAVAGAAAADEEGQDAAQQQHQHGDNGAAAAAAGAAPPEFQAAEGEVVERVPGDMPPMAAAAAAGPALVLRSNVKPPKNYLTPPTRKMLEEHFGTPGVNDRCYLCARSASTRGTPCVGVQRMMEAYEELQDHHHKSIIVRTEELHKVFQEIRAELDEAARHAYSIGRVKEVRRCPDFHPLLIWEHLYDSHPNGNHLGDVVRVTMARVSESADVVYKNQYYYREHTPDGREITMVDPSAWKMLREHYDMLARLESAMHARSASGGGASSSSSSARGKSGGGGGGGKTAIAATTVPGMGARAPGDAELQPHTRKLFGDVSDMTSVYGKPSDIRLFAQATGKQGAATLGGRRGDEKA